MLNRQNNFPIIGVLVIIVFLFFFIHKQTNEIQYISNNNNKILKEIVEMKETLKQQLLSLHTIPTDKNSPSPIPCSTNTINSILPERLKPFLKSQSKQDKYLYEKFFWSKKTPGIYVEFGARDGKEHSNTYFYEYGLNWTGLLVEFEDNEFKNLAKNRPRSIIIQGAVCNERKIKEMALSKYGGWHGDPDHVVDHRKPYLGKKVQVKCYTLNELLTTAGIRYVDYMSVDTEGSELSIIEKFDFEKFVVDIIQIEVLMGEKEIKRKIHELMISKGYDHIEDYVVTPNDTWDLIYKRNVRVDMFKIKEIQQNGWPKNFTDFL